ncbi:MAG: hypothetical protein R3E77_11185 [Steroidobacteraceae bacterium]
MLLRKHFQRVVLSIRNSIAAMAAVCFLVACGGGSGVQSDSERGPITPPPAPPPSSGPAPLTQLLTRGSANPILRNGPESFDFIKAGPRSIVKVAAGDYRMWYEAIANSANDTQIAYATSSNGSNWVKRGIVLSYSQSWEKNEVAPTAVLFDADAGLWKLWYHGGGNGAPRYIGYATSTDGLAWTKYSGNPVLSPGVAGAWDDGYVADVKVLRLGASDYRMWYKGVNATSGRAQVGYALSSDGVRWSKYSGNPVFVPGNPGQWDDGSINGVTVVHDRGLFHLWYPALRSGGAATRAGDGLGYASSADGVSWFRSQSNPVLAPAANGAAPDVELGDTLEAYWDSGRYRVTYGSFNFAASPVLRGISEASIIDSSRP